MRSSRWRQRVTAAVMVEYGYFLIYDPQDERNDPRLSIGESADHDLVVTGSGLGVPVAAPYGDDVLVTVETWDHEPQPSDPVQGDAHVVVLHVEGPELSIEELLGGVAGRVWLGSQVRWHVRAYQPPAGSSELEWLIRLWPLPDPEPPDPELLWAQSGGRSAPGPRPDPTMASRLRLLGLKSAQGDG